MASINDVYNQLVTANTELTQIANDVLAGTTATQAVNSSVNTLDTDVKAGFVTIDNDLKVIGLVELAIAKLVFHLTQQADTMICALQQISQNTCGILTQVTIQTQLQKGLAEDVKVIRDIEESAHPEAALELRGLAELRAKIEACCPPVQPQPACTYVPCTVPRPIDMPSLPKVGNPTTGNPVAGN